MLADLESLGGSAADAAAQLGERRRRRGEETKERRRENRLPDRQALAVQALEERSAPLVPHDLGDPAADLGADGAARGIEGPAEAVLGSPRHLRRSDVLQLGEG